jgi:DNA-binding NarL/FixJ family response regulator
MVDTMANTIKVMLVDDQTLLRLGFSMILEAEDGIEVVGEAGDGATALAQVAALAPDVVLMDVRMPGMDGIEATRRIIEAHPKVRVIMLTTFDLDEYAFAGLKAGASGFLLKDVRPPDLVSAIKAVAAGEAALAPRVSKRLLELFGPSLPVSGGRPVVGLESLTPRETEVLTAIAEGMTNPEIAAKFSVSEATVKSHVSNIFAKLDLRDRVHAVIYAYQAGLVKPGPQA